jgi:DNA-binding transcriptional regulator YdaS (Cro superfamily)
MKTLNPIKIWMRAASAAEQDQMAALAGTTRPMLYQYAGGFRETSSERAVQIEAATMQMAKLTSNRLPVIYRTDLSSACAQCHFARKCLGAKAEFNLS